MSEHASSPESREALAAGHEKLHQEWERIMYPERDAELVEFAQICQSAANVLPTEDSRTALGFTANVMRWALWGNYGDPLPPGLEFDTQGGRTKAVFDNRILSESAFNNCYSILMDCGAQVFERKVADRRGSRSKEIGPHLGLALLENAVPRMLQLVSAPIPDNDNLRPLNSTERFVEESKLAAQVMRQCFSDDPQVVTRTGIGHQLFKRGLYEIEERRVKDKPEVDVNAQRWQRMKAYIQTLQREGRNYGIGPEHIDDHPFDDEASVAALYSEARYVDKQDYESTSLTLFSPYFIMRELLATPPTEDFDQAFTRALTIAGEMYIDGRNLTWLRTRDSPATPISFLEAEMWLHQPKTEAKVTPPTGYRLYAAERTLDEFNENFNTNNGWNFIKEDSREIGRIHQMHPLAAGRIVQLSHARGDFLTQLRPGTLGLELNTSSNLSIKVAGTTARTRTTGVMGDYRTLGEFTFNKEDPYVRCELPIAKGLLSYLCEIYAHIGLARLSADLQGCREPQVHNLVTMIAEHSAYTEPEDDEEYNAVYSFDGCRQFVHEGKLLTQCTGSATFLKLSLNMILSGGYALYPITGNLIDGPSLKVTEHMQLVLQKGGHTYILDSTPRNLQATRALQLNLMSAGAVAPMVGGKKVYVPEPRSTAPFEAVVDPEGLYRGFHDALAKAFGLGMYTEALTAEIVKLPTDDPLRRTYELSYRIKKHGSVGHFDNEVRQLLRYVTGIVAAQQQGHQDVFTHPALQRYAAPKTASLLQSLAIHLRKYIA